MSEGRAGGTAKGTDPRSSCSSGWEQGDRALHPARDSRPEEVCCWEQEGEEKSPLSLPSVACLGDH